MFNLGAKKTVKSGNPTASASPLKKKQTWERYDPTKSKGKGESKIWGAKKSLPKIQRIPSNQSSGSKEKSRGFQGIIDMLFDFRFNHDRRLFLVFSALMLIGIISIYSSSIVFAYRLTGNKFFFLVNHLKFVGIGMIAMSFFYFIRVEIITKLWFIPLFTSIGLLTYLLVLSMLGKAEVVNGATRWLELGSFQFQPSDFAKLSFVIFIAAFLSNKKVHYKDFSEYLKENLLPYSFWFFLILLLILVGNSNLGTAMVIGFIGITCYGVSAVTKHHRLGLAILLTLMVLGGLAFGIKERYRMDRIAVWANYWKTNTSVMRDEDCPNRQGCYYQFDQGLTAIGSGGATGVGLGQSIGKFYFVQTTAGDDSIIGIIAEELGFYFTAAILALYFYLVYICVSMAKDFADRPIYFYIMIGASSWIGFQTFVHVGANIGIVPLTGQTLPFISLGGSSMISLMCAMGLLLNVSKQKDYKKDEDKEAFVPSRSVKRVQRNLNL